MIFFYQYLFVFKNQSLDFQKITGKQTAIAGESYRRQSKLAFAISATYMNVWRLIILIRVKMQAKTAAY